MEQEKLEQNFQKNKNIFFETINEQLKIEKAQKGVEEFNKYYLDIFTEIYLQAATNADLTVKQYTILGNFAYLVGIGYTNQAYLSKIVCEQVANRFKLYDFSCDVITWFIKVLAEISPESLQTAKTIMNEELLKTIPQISDEFVQNKKINIQKDTFNALRSVINNSIIPVNLSISTFDILQKKTNINYQELLTLNNFINQNCKFVGKHAIKNFIKAYGSDYFANTIKEALKLVDKQKFSLIYQDSILSVKESLVKFDTTVLSKVIGAQLEDFNFEQIKIDFDAKQAEIDAQPKVEPEVKPYQRLPKEAIDNLMLENPSQFIFECFGDFVGKLPETAEDFIAGIDAISEDENYGHHIYQYLRANIEKHTVDNDFTSNKMVPQILELLNAKLETVKTEYKDIMELICAPIPSEFVAKIKTYFVNCIEDLILTTEEQKQFLISQIIETDIETYNHLQQIITLIETCEITGNEMLSYVTLHNYLKTNTTIEEVFKKINGKEQSEVKIAIYCEFQNFLNKLDSLEKESK